MESRIPQAALKWIIAAILAGLTLASCSAATEYEILHKFGNKPANGPVSGLAADSAGNLYGMTTYGGGNTTACGHEGCGAVFELATSGASWTYSVIHVFNGADGDQPYGSLFVDAARNLYGTTSLGGSHNLGTAFELSPSASGWKEKVLYNFGASTKDLQNPLSALTPDAKGNLYGTAQYGGATGNGGVFQLNPSSGGWKEKIIYSFSGGADGALPLASLVRDSAGDFYGTSSGGGNDGEGVVFELTPTDGGWSETVLYSFTGLDDGGKPFGGVILNGAGTLYGTTGFGGLSGCDSNNGCGTVFQLTPSVDKWTFTTLLTFDWTDGATPTALTMDSAGNLYGNAELGGDVEGDGLVFELSQSAGSWTETVLHAFNWKDGASPRALILSPAGVLYGVAANGGTGFGVVFSITP